MLIDVDVLPALARGCSVLGAGGGGDVYTGVLASRQAIETHGPVQALDLDELPDDGLVMPCGYIGAPTVSIEKLGSAREGEWLRDGLQRQTGKEVAALTPAGSAQPTACSRSAWAAHRAPDHRC